MKSLTDSILSGDGEVLARQLSELRLQSIEPKRFLEQYLYFLRELAFEQMNETPSLSRVLRLFDACTAAYSRMKEFPNGFMLLELTLLGQLVPTASSIVTASSTEKRAISPVAVKPVAQKAEKLTTSKPESSLEAQTPPLEVQTPSEQKIDTTTPSTPVSTSKKDSVSTPKKDFSFTDLVSHVRSAPKK